MMRPTIVVRFLLLLLLAAPSGAHLAAQAGAPGKPVAEQTPLPDSRGPYTVGPSDVLKITVFNEDSLSGTYRVDADGSISYAILGSIHIAGRTEREIALVLEKLLKDGYLTNPQVNVQIQDYRSRSIFIMGEVRTPGKYALQGESSLLEVLAMAGSITGNASTDIVVLRPKSAEGRSSATLPDASTDAALMRVDLQAIEQGRMSGNIQLQDGDTVFVAKAEKFYITGHVRSPGAYPLIKGMTVQQAIAVAGGITDRGSSRRLKVRRDVNGVVKDIDINMSSIVLPNDTITIPQRLI